MKISKPGWAFEYDIGKGTRIGVLQSSSLEAGLKKKYKNALAHLAIFASDPNILTNPVSIFRGLQRPCYFDDETGWYVADKINIIVTHSRHNYVQIGGKVVKQPAPLNWVFVTYLLEGIDRAILEKWEKDLHLDDIPSGKICGYEWVRCDPLNPHLPLEADSRYKEEL